MKKYGMIHYGFFLCCGMALLCGGCYKLGYNEVVPTVAATGHRSVVVVTHDQRPYVVSGQTKPDVIGVKREQYGNPWQISTASGHPLAEDMTQVICNGLQKQGFQCIPIQVMPSESTDVVRRRLKEGPGDTALLLTVRDWRSDTWVKTILDHNTSLEVFDRDGTLLAQTSVQGADKGADTLPGVTSTFSNAMYTSLPLAMKSILEELLNYPTVVMALQRP